MRLGIRGCTPSVVVETSIFICLPRYCQFLRTLTYLDIWRPLCQDLQGVSNLPSCLPDVSESTYSSSLQHCSSFSSGTPIPALFLFLQPFTLYQEVCSKPLPWMHFVMALLCFLVLSFHSSGLVKVSSFMSLLVSVKFLT